MFGQIIGKKTNFNFLELILLVNVILKIIIHNQRKKYASQRDKNQFQSYLKIWGEKKKRL